MGCGSTLNVKRRKTGSAISHGTIPGGKRSSKLMLVAWERMVAIFLFIINHIDHVPTSFK